MRKLHIKIQDFTEKRTTRDLISTKTEFEDAILSVPFTTKRLNAEGGSKIIKKF